MPRKRFTAAFKSKVAIEALKGHKTIAELSGEFDVHPTQVKQWKQDLISLSQTAFNQQEPLKAQRALEEERDRLYAQIGKLKVEVDWLKKKTGHLD